MDVQAGAYRKQKYFAMEGKRLFNRYFYERLHMDVRAGVYRKQKYLAMEGNKTIPFLPHRF